MGPWTPGAPHVALDPRHSTCGPGPQALHMWPWTPGTPLVAWCVFHPPGGGFGGSVRYAGLGSNQVCMWGGMVLGGMGIRGRYVGYASMGANQACVWRLGGGPMLCVCVVGGGVDDVGGGGWGGPQSQQANEGGLSLNSCLSRTVFACQCFTFCFGGMCIVLYICITAFIGQPGPWPGSCP